MDMVLLLAIFAAILTGLAVGWNLGYFYGKETMLKLLESHLPPDSIYTDLSAKEAMAYERAVLEGRRPLPRSPVGSHECRECGAARGHYGGCSKCAIPSLRKKP